MQTSLEKRIAPFFWQKKLKLVMAESCTGGLISHRITNTPGASEYFLGGVITYADTAKEALLGVKGETLQQFGAVSRETVLEMAMGARRVFAFQGYPLDEIVGLAVSGVAGPGGGTVEKPVGLVWISLSAVDGEWAWKYRMDGNRLDNKQSFSEQALQLLWAYLSGYLPPES